MAIRQLATFVVEHGEITRVSSTTDEEAWQAQNVQAQDDLVHALGQARWVDYMSALKDDVRRAQMQQIARTWRA